MLSIQRCRALLGKVAADMSDDEVLSVRDQLAVVVETALDGMPGSAPREAAKRACVLQAVPVHLREDFDERAGIMQFEGGLTPTAAEQAAVLSVVKGRGGTS